MMASSRVRISAGSWDSAHRDAAASSQRRSILRLKPMFLEGMEGIVPERPDRFRCETCQVLRGSSDFYKRHNHLVQTQAAVGNEDFSEGGEGGVGMGDEDPGIVGEQAVAMPEVGLGEGGLDVPGSIFVAVDAGALSAGLDEEAFGGLAYPVGFGVAVVAGEVDGETAGEEVVEEGFEGRGAGVQPETEGVLRIRRTEQSAVEDFVEGGVHQAEGLCAVAEDGSFFFEVKPFVGAGVGGEALRGPKAAPMAGFFTIVSQSSGKLGGAQAADESLARDGCDRGNLGEEQAFGEVPGGVMGLPGITEDRPVGEGNAVEDEKGDFVAFTMTQLTGEEVWDVEEVVRSRETLPGEGGVPALEPGGKGAVEGFLQGWVGCAGFGRQFEGAVIAEDGEFGPAPGEGLPVFPAGGAAGGIGFCQGGEQFGEAGGARVGVRGKDARACPVRRPGGVGDFYGDEVAFPDEAREGVLEFGIVIEGDFFTRAGLQVGVPLGVEEAGEGGGVGEEGLQGPGRVFGEAVQFFQQGRKERIGERPETGVKAAEPVNEGGRAGGNPRAGSAEVEDVLEEVFGSGAGAERGGW